MPIELTWLIPDKILLSCWADLITEDDMHILVEELNIILSTSEQIIHTVIEMTESHEISDTVVYEYYRSTAAKHPRRGRIALVNPTFQIRVLADVLNRVAERELFHMCATRDEARCYLLANDTLPPVYYTGYDQPAHLGSL